MVGSALVRRLAREDCEILTVTPRRSATCAARSRSSAGWRGAARGGVGRRRQGRRHPRQRPLAGRVPLRQPDDRGERHPHRPAGRASRSCCSSARPASTPSSRRSRCPRTPADRAARADQPVVRDRQDRRHQAVPGLSAPVRLRLHLRDADQPLRPRRQFRPPVEPRRAGADRQDARTPSRPAPTRSRSGAPARRGASSCTSTTWPTRASTCSRSTAARASTSTSAAART